MGVFAKLLGTTLSKFQLGIGGPQIKNNSGVVEARTAADSAYAAISAALVNVYGDDFVLNKGATESGGSWIFKISRPSTGMTEDVQIIMPPDAAPSPGQALTVGSAAGGVITMAWASIAAGTDLVKVTPTSLAFGSSSPLTMFTLAANMVVLKVQVIVDTPFTGGTGPSLSIGVSGTASKYMGATDVDLTAAASTVFEVNPGLAADGSSESLIATYAANSATAGAARILVHYCDPS
jgi:hypothetical protein